MMGFIGFIATFMMAFSCLGGYRNCKSLAEWDEEHLPDMREVFPKQYVKPSRFIRKHFNLTSKREERLHYTIYFNYILALTIISIVPVCIVFSIVSFFTIMAFLVPYILFGIVGSIFFFNILVLRTIFIIQTKIHKKTHKSSNE